MINRVVLVGRLTKTPELKTTTTGLSVITFTLAFDNKTKGADGQRASSFINCTAWRQSAEFVAKYCEKGTQIGVDGSLQERRYQRRDGTNASVIEVVVDSVTLLGSKNQNSATSSQTVSAPASAYQEDEPTSNDLLTDDGDLADDDLPF